MFVAHATVAQETASTLQNSQSSKSTTDDLNDLFNGEDYFAEDSRDSLADLLKGKSKHDNTSAVGPRVSDDNAGDMTDEPETNDLYDTRSDFETDDEEADEELRYRYTRQRAMISHLQKLQRPVHQIRISSSVSETRLAPSNAAASVIGDQPKQLITANGNLVTSSNRYPTDYSHRPLYFEETDLERCGNHLGCLQNLASGSHFLLNTAVLPYRLATERPDAEVPTRGDCRTGQSFSTRIKPLIDHGWNPRGILGETAAIAGFTFLLL